MSQPTSKSKENNMSQPLRNLVLTHSQQENIDFVTQKLQEFRFVRKTTEKVAGLSEKGGKMKGEGNNAGCGSQEVIGNGSNSVNTMIGC